MSDTSKPPAGASSPAPAGSAGLVDGAAERFVEDLHKLSRQQLAEVAAYCIQLMAKPRHTVIPDDHWMLKHQCAEQRNERLAVAIGILTRNP